MKTKILLLVFLAPFILFSQTQIGADVDGEAASIISGLSVSMSSDGNIVAIGAPNTNSFTGQVRIYQNNSGVWTQIGNDIEGEAEGDKSGLSVSLSPDGTTVAIGAELNDGVNGVNSGHVRVYKNSSDVWIQIGDDIDGEDGSGYSGSSVSLSADGNKLAIGASSNDGNGWDSGHVRIFQNSSDVWTQIGNDINGEASFDHLGGSVSLSANGSIVAIGASGNDVNGDFTGHVRVYQNNSGNWAQVGNDIDGEAAWDHSGGSVSLSSDGSTVAIGAVRNDGNNASNNWDIGHVRIYKNNSGVWNQVGNDIDGEAHGDWSGQSVSLSADGTIVAIGAALNDGNGEASGHVRVYKNNSGVWTQIGVDIDGETEGDQSGYSVSLSSDGTTLAIGAPYNDGINGLSSGHVRVYDLSTLLSLEANEIAENFTVHPNPVDNQLQLQLSTTLEFKIASIYNYYGQLVLQSETTTIDVSNLSSGVYFLEVETNKGKGVKKIIKK